MVARVCKTVAPAIDISPSPAYLFPQSRTAVDERRWIEILNGK